VPVTGVPIADSFFPKDSTSFLTHDPSSLLLDLRLKSALASLPSLLMAVYLVLHLFVVSTFLHYTARSLGFPSARNAVRKLRRPHGPPFPVGPPTRAPDRRDPTATLTSS